MTSPSPEAPPDQVVVISHSAIFYWWPVWFVGFLMAAWTRPDGPVMAAGPRGTVAEAARKVEGHDEPRDVLVLPPGTQLPVDRATGAALQPRPGMAASNSPGVLYAITLCLVIVI